MFSTIEICRPIQTRLAKHLQCLVGVQCGGPCGLAEVALFQVALQGYQIKVMTVDPPYGVIYKGPTPSNKLILLLKSHNHYDGCNSFSGFLSRSYYCHECDTGYDHESLSEHPCDGKWCGCCHTKNCPDFLMAKRSECSPRPSRHCSLCQWSFFGDTCLANHHQGSAGQRASSLCHKSKKCATCSKDYDVAGKNPKHNCGVSECPY